MKHKLKESQTRILWNIFWCTRLYAARSLGSRDEQDFLITFFFNPSELLSSVFVVTEVQAGIMHLCRELIESKLLQDLCGGEKDSKGLSFMSSGDNFLSIQES